MAYTDSPVLAISPGVDNAGNGDFSASGTVVCRVNQACDLYAVGALITVALDTNLAGLTVTRNVIPGSTVGATAVAILVIPTLTAAGKIVWKNCHILTVVAPVKLNAGDELKFVWDSGGGSVKWRPWFEAYPRTEVKENNSDFIPSA